MPTKNTDNVENNAKKTKKNTQTASKKTTKKENITRKSTAKSTKTSSKKKSAVKSKIATRKVAIKKDVSKKIAKKTIEKNKNQSPSIVESLINKDLTEKFNVSEYYDLPAKYEKTVVKILAQTPNTLFVYWDISDEDRNNLINQYGQYFFYDTKPVLKITNETKGYSFEIDINDFANCWYLHINDAKCKYNVELGRRPITSIKLPNNYVYISSSNIIEAPNDHILFENTQNMVYFKNVKTNQISKKPLINFTFMRNLGKYYNIFDFYKKAYKDEDFSTSTKLVGNSSSVFK